MSNSKYTHLFDTAQVKKDIKSKSINAGIANLASQCLLLILAIIRAAILARLLTPADYGVFTMVAVLVSFAVIFKDLGLSTATIREKTITHYQVSNLFWINSCVGVISMLIVIALSPVIVWFYNDSRLVLVTMTLSIAFLFGGASVQHQALLKRQMEFKKIAFITVSSRVGSTIIGIILAWQQYGYWALIWMNVSQSFFIFLSSWHFLKWIPGLPTRYVETKKFIKIGLDVAGLNAFSTLSKHIDKIIIGRITNTTSLGIYGKGNQVPQMVTEQFRMAFFSIALPALSSLQNEKEQFLQYYYNFLHIISWVTMPISAFCFIFSDDIIRIYFGPQWIDSSFYMKIFAINSFIMPAMTTLDQIPLALGQSRRYLYAGILRCIGIIICVSIGAYTYGLTGAAIGISIANILIFMPFFIICTKGSGVLLTQYVNYIISPVLISLIPNIFYPFFQIQHDFLNIPAQIFKMAYYVASVLILFIICDYFHIGCKTNLVMMITKKIKVIFK